MFVVASNILTVSVSVTYIVIIIAPDRMRCWERTQKFHHTTEEHRCGIFFLLFFCCVPFFPLFLLHFRFGEKQAITISVGSTKRIEKRHIFYTYCWVKWQLWWSESVWMKKQNNVEHWTLKQSNIYVYRTSWRTAQQKQRRENWWTGIFRMSFVSVFFFILSFAIHFFLLNLLYSTLTLWCALLFRSVYAFCFVFRSFFFSSLDS